MKILLLSTYELGRQPFGLVSPAAWLRKRGHTVVSLDLARQSLDEKAVREARLIAIYLPMHTATRLAIELLPWLRTQNSNAVLCCYGLYAPMNAAFLRTLGVTNILGGEFEKALAELADRLAIQDAYIIKDTDHLATASESSTSLERLTFEVPDRAGLPPLAQYANLVMPGGAVRVVGSTEASRGCKHLCRHCPIVPVYNGVFRIVQRDVVLEDIRRRSPPAHSTFLLVIPIFSTALVTRCNSWKCFIGNFPP